MYLREIKANFSKYQKFGGKIRKFSWKIEEYYIC